jgi:plastocyanin
MIRNIFPRCEVVLHERVRIEREENGHETTTPMDGDNIRYLDHVRVAGGSRRQGPTGAQHASGLHDCGEMKGSTTTDTLPPPAVNPADRSKGYGFKGPGEAEKTVPQRWEVASYSFVPGFITVPQGDTVRLTVFVVNGDQHDVAVLAPDGQVVVPTAIWQRGREYQVSFVGEKVGTYQLKCFAHAPTMTANMLVVPR